MPNHFSFLLYFSIFLSLFIVEPHEVKRAPCRNARDDYYCFLEAMYDDACSSSPGDMRMKCAKECGFCWSISSVSKRYGGCFWRFFPKQNGHPINVQLMQQTCRTAKAYNSEVPWESSCSRGSSAYVSFAYRAAGLITRPRLLDKRYTRTNLIYWWIVDYRKATWTYTLSTSKTVGER